MNAVFAKDLYRMAVNKNKIPRESYMLYYKVRLKKLLGIHK